MIDAAWWNIRTSFRPPITCTFYFLILKFEKKMEDFYQFLSLHKMYWRGQKNEDLIARKRSPTRNRLQKGCRGWRANSLVELIRVAKVYIRYKANLYADSLLKSRNEDPQIESSRRPLQEKQNQGKLQKEGRWFV